MTAFGGQSDQPPAKITLWWSESPEQTTAPGAFFTAPWRGTAANTVNHLSAACKLFANHKRVRIFPVSGVSKGTGPAGSKIRHTAK